MTFLPHKRTLIDTLTLTPEPEHPHISRLLRHAMGSKQWWKFFLHPPSHRGWLNKITISNILQKICLGRQRILEDVTKTLQYKISIQESMGYNQQYI